MAHVADVPVGGGLVLSNQRVVLTQPTQGSFRALLSVCTHQGCDISSVEAGRLQCPCHGSAFGLDGAVLQGPASSPLVQREVKVSGNEIFLS